MNVETKSETRTVERVVTEEVTETKVVLELTEDEAATLAAVFGRMVGWNAGEDNPRNITDEIYHELNDAGYAEGNDKHDRVRALIGRGDFKFSAGYN